MGQVVTSAHSDLVSDGAVITVHLRGEYDISTLDAVSRTFASAVVLHDGDVVVDLSAVDFMDASTMHVLARVDLILAAQKRALHLRNPSRVAARVLDTIGDRLGVRS